MTRKLYTTSLIISLLLLLVALSACDRGNEGGADMPLVASSHDSGGLPAGSDLISKMKNAVNAVNSTNFRANFQFGTVEGAVKGSFEFWGERANKSRTEITSKDESLSGIVLVTNEEKSWAYSPYENLVLISQDNEFKVQLHQQPELREMLEFAEKVAAQGVETSQAQTLGTETINGRETYKVEAKYDNPELAGMSVIYYIDKESAFPQRVELKIKRDNMKVSGFIEVTGELNTGGSIDAAQFTFTPPDRAILFDLANLPPLPDFSSNNIFKEE